METKPKESGPTGVMRPNEKHTWHHEKITSDKCRVVYHMISNINGADGGYTESFMEVSDDTSLKAYTTMRKLMDDIADDQRKQIQSIVDAGMEDELNSRASSALDVR
jgi:hypothetical protein